MGFCEGDFVLRTSGGKKLTDTSDWRFTELFWTQLDNSGGGEWVRAVNLAPCCQHPHKFTQPFKGAIPAPVKIH